MWHCSKNEYNPLVSAGSGGSGSDTWAPLPIFLSQLPLILLLDIFSKLSIVMFVQFCHWRFSLQISEEWVPGSVCVDFWGVRSRQDGSLKEDITIHSNHKHPPEWCGPHQGQAPSVQSHSWSKFFHEYWFLG